MSKVLWIDVETTGLDPVKCGITQIGLLIEVDGDIVFQKSYRMAPLPGDQIADEALAVQGATKDEVMGYPSPLSVFSEFIADLHAFIDKFDPADKAYFGGFNARFDADFIREWHKKCAMAMSDAETARYGFGCYTNWRTLDPLQLLYMIDYHVARKLPSLKLVDMCEQFHIPLVAHDALGDIRATYVLWYIINQSIIMPQIIKPVLPQYQDRFTLSGERSVQFTAAIVKTLYSSLLKIDAPESGTMSTIDDETLDALTERHF